MHFFVSFVSILPYCEAIVNTFGLNGRWPNIGWTNKPGSQKIKFGLRRIAGFSGVGPIHLLQQPNHRQGRFCCTA